MVYKSKTMLSTNLCFYLILDKQLGKALLTDKPLRQVLIKSHDEK